MGYHFKFGVLMATTLVNLVAPTCVVVDAFKLYKPSHVRDIVKERGFKLNEHSIYSQGYLLKVYQLINPLADPTKLHPVPVVASHGISFDMSNMLSSSTYARPRVPSPNERVTLCAMENGTDDRGLHFYLSNNNYDVWMIEARATNDENAIRLKDRHYNKSFWDFGIDEQALFDLPAQIDFVLNQTGRPQVALVAYSQSTTFTFAMLSMRPEYEEKLAAFVAIAPVAFSNHIKFPQKTISSQLLIRGTSAIPYWPSWLRNFLNFESSYLCSVEFIRSTACKAAWEYLQGHGLGGPLEGTMATDPFKITSLKTFAQFRRNHYLGDFRMFDYEDDAKNMKEYGQVIPPAYNLTKITLRSIVFFRGTEDYLSDPEDQMILISKLQVPLFEDHVLVGYSHFDFMLSPTVVRDVNEPLLKVLDRLTNRQVYSERHTFEEPDSTGVAMPITPLQGPPGSGVLLA